MQRPAATRALGWSMAALLAAPALVLLAWLASNWRDAPALPRPAALVPAPPRLAEARNAYRALTDIKLAAPGSERRLADPTGAPWYCSGGGAGCAPGWLAQPEALAVQRQAIAWGARCDALLDGDFAFDELLPQPMSMSMTGLATHLSGAVGCQRWFQTGAVLAFVRDDREALQRDLARADRLNRALLSGSHSLIASMVALRGAQSLMDTVALLAVRDAGLVETLAPLLADWPAQTDVVRRWIGFESTYGQHAISESFEKCTSLNELIDQGVVRVDPPRSAADRLEDAASAWLCRHRIGMLPQRTAQYADAYWLEQVAALERGGLAALDARAGEDAADGAAGFKWLNTFGAQIVDIGRGAHQTYARRHLDLELQHRLVTLVLAMQRDGIAAPARVAWLASQVVPAAQRERIALRDGGYTIAARSFSSNQPSLGDQGEFAVTWPR